MLWLFEERERDECLLFLRIRLVFENSYELIHTCWRSLIYLKYLLLSDDIWLAFCIGIGAKSLHNAWRSTFSRNPIVWRDQKTAANETTVFIRLNAAALIKVFEIQVRRLFEGGVSFKIQFIICKQ